MLLLAQNWISFYWQELACKFCAVMPVPVILESWSKSVMQIPESEGSDAKAPCSIANAVVFMTLVIRHCFLNLVFHWQARFLGGKEKYFITCAFFSHFWEAAINSCISKSLNQISV